MNRHKKVIFQSLFSVVKTATLGFALTLLTVLSAFQYAVAETDNSNDLGRPSIGTTENEAAVKANFLKTSTEKHTRHVSFMSIRVGGGLLSGGDYDKFAAFNNANITRTDGGVEGLGGLSNSYEIGVEMGVMTGKKTSVSVNFDYWLKNGSNTLGDFTLAVEPIGSQTGFELKSEIAIFGLAGNFGYFLLNPPSRTGTFKKGLSIEAIGSAGFYFTKWDLWQGSGNINLSTSLFEQIGGSLKDQAPGFSAGLRLALPTNIFGTSLAIEGSYMQLKFTNPRWNNALNQEIFATFSANSADKVGLDFSGLRSKFEIRKFMSW